MLDKFKEKSKNISKLDGTTISYNSNCFFGTNEKMIIKIKENYIYVYITKFDNQDQAISYTKITKSYIDDKFLNVFMFPYSWEEIYKDNGVLDGESWSIKLGGTLTKEISGYVAYPDNYKEWKNIVKEIIDNALTGKEYRAWNPLIYRSESIDKSEDVMEHILNKFIENYNIDEYFLNEDIYKNSEEDF